MEKLTILTINTWKCDGDYLQRIDWMASEIEKINADIVVCQEVFRTICGKYDTLKMLQKLGGNLRDKPFFGKNRFSFARLSPAREKNRNVNKEFLESISGLGILSVYPILDSFDINLPNHPDDGERIAQFSIIKVNNAQLLIINTHLTHLKEEFGLRINQIKAILSQDILKESFDAILLCGDFNCTEDSATIQYLYQHPDFKISNAFRRAEVKSAKCITLPNKNVSEICFPAVKDGRCIDFIFLIEKRTHSNLKVYLAQIVLDVPNKAGIFPSDHFGVMASIEV